MTRADAMTARLPQLYRDGELVRGLLGVTGAAVEVYDEDMRAVQREHHFEQAVDLDDAAGLAAVLDMAPEDWHDIRAFRAWVTGMRDAQLLYGGVTSAGIRHFVGAYATGSGALDLGGGWVDDPAAGRAALVECPSRRREHSAGSPGIEPLQQLTLENRSDGPAPLGVLLHGLPEAEECVPVIANLTTGRALVVLEKLAPGQRLWLGASRDGSTALGRLERRDVSGSLRSVDGIVPGRPWTPEQARSPALPLTLARGRNQLWFLPVAHFDIGGLDRFLLSLADLALRIGRYDASGFDHALFALDPAATLQVAWEERAPACFELHLPGVALAHPAGQAAAASERRMRAGESIAGGVARLRAAGVHSSVSFDALGDRQPAADALVHIGPLVVRDGGPMGADRLPDAGGIFGVTDFDTSTFR